MGCNCCPDTTSPEKTAGIPSGMGSDFSFSGYEPSPADYAKMQAKADMEAFLCSAAPESACRRPDDVTITRAMGGFIVDCGDEVSVHVNLGGVIDRLYGLFG